MSPADELEARLDALEAAGRFTDAIAELERFAAESGEDVRWHVAWMATRGEDHERAGALWNELRTERPDDPGVAYLHAGALLEDGYDEAALPLLAEALLTGLRVASDEALLRQIADDRLAVLRRTGGRPEAIDHRARELLGRRAPAIPWFSAAEFSAACERWGPDRLAPAGDDHSAYCAAIDRSLRTVGGVNTRNPRLVALDVATAEAFAAGEGWGPSWPVTHDQIAAAVLRNDPGAGMPWPPGRNEPCWCGSGRKYKRCCGTG